MIKLFTSLKFTFWIIVAISAWLITGAAMTSAGFKQAFLEMNDMLVLDWLIYEASNEPLVFLWFVILCFLAALLGINFIFCTVLTLFRLLKFRNFSLRTIILLSLHIACIAIVLLHATGLVAGFKQGYIKAFKDDIIDLPSGYQVVITDIIYENDIDLLKSRVENQSKIRYSRDNFSIGVNCAEVVLLRHGKVIGEGKTYYMKPFRADGIWVTLESFQFSLKRQHSGIGVRLTVAKNPVLMPFIIVYALVVFLLFFYTAISWGNPFLQENGLSTASVSIKPDALV